MKYFLLSMFSMIFFSGCAVSSLGISDTRNLSLKNDNKHIEITNTILKKERQWYEYIDISQYKLKNNDTVLFYEYVELDTDWEFIFGPITTLKYILEGANSNTLYKGSAISLVQLKITNSKHINLLIESSGFHDMSYVYGFSDKEFLTLASSLGHKYTKKDLKKGSTPILLQSNMQHLSKWSVTMLFLRPLIQPSIRQISSY